MTESTSDTTFRVGAGTEENPGSVTTPSEPTPDVVVAHVPGQSTSTFVTITLAHPLNEQDRINLGLPKDASTEVGQQVSVNKNGARQIINAGYATVDPEDASAVRAALRTSDSKGEPSAAPAAEAPQAAAVADITPADPEVAPQQAAPQAPAATETADSGEEPVEGAKAEEPKADEPRRTSGRQR